MPQRTFEEQAKRLKVWERYKNLSDRNTIKWRIKGVIMTKEQRPYIKSALLKCADENEGKGTCTGYVVISSVCRSAAERIEELENALKKIEETVPNSYKDYGYLPESRLDVIGDICEEVLEE